MLGVTFLQTNFAPVLDLDQHFMRDTVQTGPTPGFTFFPHVGTVRIEGPFNAKQAKDSASRRKIFVCTPTGAADEAACAREDRRRSLATKAFRRPAATGEVNALMEFYKDAARKEEASFENGIENGAGAPSRRPEVHLPHRSRAGDGEARRALSHLRSRPGVAPVVLPVEHAAPTTN